MSHKPTGRKRGAPLGNTNHLLHGAYSQHISIEAKEDLESMPQDQNQDELALARSRLIACLERQKSAPPEQWPIYERVVQKYLQDISRLTHNNAILGKDRNAALATVFDMIRHVNNQQHVR